MDRDFSRGWFLNSTEWLRVAYETFGAKHPAGSMIVVVLLGALSFGSVWYFAGRLYEKDQASNKTPAAAIEQKAQDSNCSNVVGGRDVNINCSSGQENGNAKERPKAP